MVKTGKLKNRRRGVWLLFILFSLGLACLVCAEAAESRASDGRYVATDWARRYQGPTGDDTARAITLDAQGNIYVTGSSDSVTSISDIVTIKYSPDGQRLWARRYHNPENYSAFASSMVMDSQGNVCIAGYILYDSNPHYGNGTRSVIIKYDPDGQLLWESRSDVQNDAGALAVDAQDNFYITGTAGSNYTMYGSPGYDYATTKYSPDGQELWVRRYNGPGNADDFGAALAVDGQGNVYVTGASGGAGTNYDYATVKYSPEGEKLWVRRYNGPGNFEDWAQAIAVDSQGNVYVTGASFGTGYDYATVKYSPEGEKLWVRRYNGPGNFEDWAQAIAVDAQGNVLVTGKSWGDGTDMDYATVKYSPAGKRLWVRRYNGPGNGWDEPTAMALDGQGNVYVTGGSWGLGEKYESATIKYGPDGRRLWLRRYTVDGDNAAWAMATDAQANVFITGNTFNSDKGNGYLTVKFTQTP